MCHHVIDAPGAIRRDGDAGEFALYRLDNTNSRSDTEMPALANAHTSGRVQPPSDDVLNVAYNHVLARLTLRAEHRRDMEERGFDDDAIMRIGVKSIPTVQDEDRFLIGESLRIELGESVAARVPGVLRNKGGRLYLGGSPGMAIPVRDLDGRVVALRIRSSRLPGAEEGPKYLWLSSTKQGGMSAGARIHVPLPSNGSDTWLGTEEVVVTEGELKAERATIALQRLVISVPGVALGARALPVLRKIGAKRVAVAYDSDAEKNEHVARSERRLCEELRREGYDVTVIRWSSEAKGLDDALQAACPMSTTPFHADPAYKPISEQPEETRELPLNGHEKYGVAAQAIANAILEAHVAGDPGAHLRDSAREALSTLSDAELECAHVFLREGGLSSNAAKKAVQQGRSLRRERTRKKESRRDPREQARPTSPELGEEHHDTDVGNAKRLATGHGMDLRYNHAAKRWSVWDERHWSPDTTGEVMRKAKATVNEMFLKAAASEGERRQASLKWALTSEAEARLNAMIALAASEPGIPVLTDQLDADPWLLNCQNGIVDLRTGALGPHRRGALMTKIVAVEYDPAAICPTWEACLDTWMDGASDLILYLQRLAGYCLTGRTTEHCLFLHYGTGRNGKSTFNNTMRSILADYAKQAEFSTFLERKSDAVRNDIADLRGARFVVASEAENGARLAEAVVKTATGGDVLKARFLFQEFFEFAPEFKLHLAVNHKPMIRGTDEGIWSRVRLIPWNVTIPREKRDKDLPDRLKEELPGILAWAVRGCLEWQRTGLADPPGVVAATGRYRAEMDNLGGFIAEKCVLMAGVSARASALYAAYRKWAEDEGGEAISQTAFGRGLAERGFERTRTNTGAVWGGIGLTAPIIEDWKRDG